MGIGDKISNMAEDAKGKLKEGAGKATGDDQQVAEGKADQSGADMKQAGENVKDGDFKGAASDAKDAFDH